MKQLSTQKDVYVDSMAIEDTRLKNCSQVIKVAPYLQMEMRQMLYVKHVVFMKWVMKAS